MPTLGGQKTEKLVLPSSTPEDEAWVILNKNLPAKDALEFQDEDLKDTKSSFKILAKYIQEWNFTNADGTPSDITEENVGLLSVGDIVEITKALDLDVELPDLKKKQSVSTSSDSEPTPPSTTSS